MKRFVLVLCLIPLLFACSTINKMPSVCDTLQEKSYLCDTAKKFNVRLETMGDGLVIANAVALTRKVYTPEQAVAVMKEIREALDNPISYVAFKAKIDDMVRQYPGLLLVASSYMAELGALTETILPADRRLIVGWLDGQIKILGGV